jgi:hypothetical protein
VEGRNPLSTAMNLKLASWRIQRSDQAWNNLGVFFNILCLFSQDFHVSSLHITYYASHEPSTKSPAATTTQREA